MLLPAIRVSMSIWPEAAVNPCTAHKNSPSYTRAIDLLLIRWPARLPARLPARRDCYSAGRGAQGLGEGPGIVWTPDGHPLPVPVRSQSVPPPDFVR